ncbi:hypothetical protein [Morganella morganii]|uniref:hypothetical protein n=1 Tax=Morganella morganii TaxID=582 RepID=UPI000B41D700|nr:hypothetical protein [Morganella morganii]ELA8731673.1 hypothetical protein [Morganella morganii]MBC4000344.1 hypothetical protein [Morganella morganii]MBT0313048.1 hypothetical protein [Morganella morganii subsp. morganii]MBT0387035.1 hypothetical protein [Morganella morganii subsp. morganii]MBT0466545.1 hypothetical protein [Morganella morganii subsp. morganii]
MFTDISLWFYGVISSVAITGLMIYIARSAISRFLTKSIEYQFEKKLEKFKSDIKESENELIQIRNYITSSRRERDSMLQLKRFEAAEVLIRSRQALSSLTAVVEYMKNLNIDAIMEKGNDYKITEFINGLITPLNIDENIKAYKEIDKTLIYLYLGEKSQRKFKIYESIIFDAIAKIKILAIPLENKSEMIKHGSIAKIIIEDVPLSKDSFDKYGDSYALHWLNYFYTETLNELLNELNGKDNMIKETEAATRLAIDSRTAQTNIISSLNKHGLPTELFDSHPVPDIN